jgi:hypothetical protein
MHPSIRAFLLVYVLALAAPALAQAPPPVDFNAAKQHRLEEIARHMEKLRRMQACVQNATDFTQLQSCHPAPRR